MRKLPRAIVTETVRDGLFETAAQILQIDNFFIEKLDASALRPSARLLFYIMVNRSVSIKEAMLDSPLSYRAFYIMIDRLKDVALLDVESDQDDRRVRRLVLGQGFDDILGNLPVF
ncbi:MAG: hypothetical protein AABY88_04045 [Pseudomonadota bacterium]